MAYILNEYDSSKLLLTAINILLQNINELPIESDTDLSNSTTGKLAEMTIIEVKKKVLAEGWNFNTDESYLFPIDVNGEIPIPYNVLDIVATNDTYTMRDWKLYDKVNATFKFEDSVPCNVIWDMDFNSLTHPLRDYITIRSARVFQARTIGDELGYKFSQADEENSYLLARTSESRTGKYNMLNGLYGSQYGGLR